MVAWAALAAGGAGLASGLLGSSASKDAASAMKKTAKRQLKFAKRVYGDTAAAASDATRRTMVDANATRAAGTQAMRREYNALTDYTGDLRNASYANARRGRDAELGAYGDTYNRSRRDLTNGRDAAIAEWRPTATAGSNALDAYDYNLGIGDRPAGYTGPALSAGERFIRNQGMTAIEGSSASRGGLNSGATLEALQQLGAGIGAQSRGRQQDELFARGQMGQNALANIAGLYSTTGGQLAGLATGYGDRVAGALGDYTVSIDRANTGYFGGMGAAMQGLTERRLGLDRARMGDVTGARVVGLNALTGAGSQLGAAGGDALGNKGNAAAAGAIGGANAWTGAINTGFGLYGALGGGFGGSGYDYGAPVTGPMPRPSGNVLANWGTRFFG